jgi:hypothetical protein
MVRQKQHTVHWRQFVVCIAESTVEHIQVIVLACFQMPDATPKQIKKAYYNCMKSCHPDLSGNDPDVTNFCMFINEVYTVKS